MSDGEILKARGRKGGTRDGLFQKRGWWWLDYYDAEGTRHRKKAAPDYNTAKLMYRDLMSKIAKGEVTGIREEGVTVARFIDERYWPTINPTVSPSWAVRTRGILDTQIVPRFGAIALTTLRGELIESWYAERCSRVQASTANKELGRLKHLLTPRGRLGLSSCEPRGPRPESQGTERTDAVPHRRGAHAASRG